MSRGQASARDTDLGLRFVRWLAASGPSQVGLGAQFRRNLPLYSAGAVMVVVQQFLLARRDFLVKGAVDGIVAGAASQAARCAALILAVSVFAMVTRLASRVTMFGGGRNVEYELRASLLAHLHRLGPSFFRRFPTGDIMSRATNDLQQVRLLLGFGVLNVVSSLLAFVSALYVMLSLSGKLTLAALSIIPMLVLVTRKFSGPIFQRTRENQAALGKMSDRVLASLAGVRVVRSFAMEGAELRAFEAQNSEYLKKSLSLARLRGAMGPIMGSISAAGVLVVFWYGGTLLANGELSTGDFVAFWLALMRIAWPMMALGFVMAIVQRGRASYARLAAIFDAEPEVVDGPEPAPEYVRGAVRVEGLSYSFARGAEPRAAVDAAKAKDAGDGAIAESAQAWVLDGVSFEVPAGGSLAIVGRTGSGKSTLAALLPRLLPVEKSTVFLDGHDVCDLPIEIVRASFGYAQQDAFLFSTTVAENIGYALDTTDGADERIRTAAAEAQVHDDVGRFAEGFDTVVGERGVQLSGGQKQRIALARALIREPAVLVLDDPLSAVDAKTEAMILEAIERQTKQRTVILVTHRIAAAKRCDQVLVLERGRVVERGTHDELMGRDGIYRLIAEAQAMDDDLAALGGAAA